MRGESGSWTFHYEAVDVRIAYTWTPSRGTLDDLEVRVDGGRPFRPAAGGGITCLVSTGDEVAEVRTEGGRAAEVRRRGDALHVRWEYPVGSRTLPVDWTFRIAGKAMAAVWDVSTLHLETGRNHFVIERRTLFTFVKA